MYSALKKAVSRVVEDWCRDLPNMTMKLGADILRETYRIGARAIGIELDEKPQQKVGEIPRQLLKGETPFGRAIGEWRRPLVYFPAGDRQHKIVIGATDAGKTEWAANYVVNLKTGCCFLDNTDGEITERIIKALPAKRLEKTVVLDHSDPHYPLPAGFFKPTGDPVLDNAVITQLVNFWETNYGITEQYMTTELISYACQAVMSLPDMTMMDVLRMVRDPSFRIMVLSRLDRKAYPEAAKYWNRYLQMSPQEQRQVAASFLRRAGLVFRDTVLRHTLGHKPKNPMDHRKWMDEGWTVLIRVPESLESITVRTIMALHVLRFWSTALHREDISQAKRKPFVVICDEPQTWLANNADAVQAIFSKARKYGLVMVTLFQSTTQVEAESKSLLRVMLDNRPDILLFTSTKEQIRKLDLEAEELEAKRYQFIAALRGHKPFVAATLGKLPILRDDVSDIITANRERWNERWDIIDSEISRRESVWELGAADMHVKTSGLPRSGIKPSVRRESRNVTERSSNSSLIIE